MANVSWVCGSVPMRAERALTMVAIMGKGISSQSQEKPIVLMPFADMEACDPLLVFAPHQ